ncbi:MAG TPA: RagB/SusD family nutrient uptake outer membrane protein, partial [Longimicrobium sp.]|nr:RagB/SusD family nutrient uptake outer membrane protein [Longimicrobium sp.]
RNLLVYPDLYADNLAFTGTFDTDAEVSERAVQPSNSALDGIWGTAYEGINRANNVIASIPEVDGISDDDAAQYLGEAAFLRALNYHNLVRWFGGVPLVLEPNWAVGDDENTFAPRATQAQVYARIEADLEVAVELLPSSSTDFRATSGAALALLARVYLDQGKDAQAAAAATAVIESGEYALTRPYSNLWAVENSPESILSIQYSVNDFNELAFWFFPSDFGGRRGFAPTADLAANFEDAGDTERYETTVGYYRSGTRRYGTKYFRIATGEDNVLVLRLAEMYLIRAEANARLGAPAQEVLDDLNVVRDRAEVAPLTLADLDSGDEEELLALVLEERRLEFAMEGHRFFDLRRILGTAGAAEFLEIPEFRLLFPIPQSERDANPNLGQNPGY